MIIKELRYNKVRSLFLQKSPFCPLFGPFYPHFAIPSALRAAGTAAIRYPRKEVAALALATVGPQPHPARATPGEPGRAADRPALASLSCLTHRQVLRNPHIAKEGRHDPDIHSLQRADKELKAPPALLRDRQAAA